MCEMKPENIFHPDIFWRWIGEFKKKIVWCSEKKILI